MTDIVDSLRSPLRKDMWDDVIQRSLNRERARAADEIGALRTRAAELEAALQRAAPYVVAFAENAPDDDGGAEAKMDLLHVRAALNE